MLFNLFVQCTKNIGSLRQDTEDRQEGTESLRTTDKQNSSHKRQCLGQKTCRHEGRQKGIRKDWQTDFKIGKHLQHVGRQTCSADSRTTGRLSTSHF